MSIPELVSSKKPIIDTAIKFIGYAIVGSWAVAQYVAKDENKDENAGRAMEIVIKRLDNHDIILGEHSKDINDIKTDVAVINTNMENMAESTNEIKTTTKETHSLIQDLIKNSK